MGPAAQASNETIILLKSAGYAWLIFHHFAKADNFFDFWFALLFMKPKRVTNSFLLEQIPFEKEAIFCQLPARQSCLSAQSTKFPNSLHAFFLLSVDFFFKLTFPKKSFMNTVRVSNSLDPDQA